MKKPSERINELALEIGEQFYKDNPHDRPTPSRFAVEAIVKYLDEQHKPDTTEDKS